MWVLIVDTDKSGYGGAFWVSHWCSVSLLEDCATHFEVVVVKTEFDHETNVINCDNAVILARCKAESDWASQLC